VTQIPPSAAESSILAIEPPVRSAAIPCESSWRKTTKIFSGQTTGVARSR
jgi:hypothetical protein